MITEEQLADLEREARDIDAMLQDMSKRDHGGQVGCKPAAFRRAGSSILSACTAVLLAGCAQTLPAISTGLDAARAGIKSACPDRTDTCEHIVTTFNAAEQAFNLALLADAVGKDASAYEASAIGYLESVWSALQAQVTPAAQ